MRAYADHAPPDPNYSKARKCAKCGKPVVNQNLTGLCRDHYRSARSAAALANGGAVVTGSPGQALRIEALPSVDELPDAYLAACVAEAQRRVEATAPLARAFFGAIRSARLGDVKEPTP